MTNGKMFVVSHAPFWHIGARVADRHYGMILAALPAVALGVIQYGLPAIAVLCFSVSTAVFWEWVLNRLMKRPITIADGNAALIGLILAMLIPATTPWWAVLVGTLIAVVIGKQIFGGIGANPFHPAVVSLMILSVSWAGLFNFDAALVDYDFTFRSAYPLAQLKAFGPAAVADFSTADLLMGRQIGGLGSTFGLGLIVGGGYLIWKRYIRWEIAVSFLAGIFVTALCFNIADPAAYGGPLFHLLTGYTLIGAFFLMPEDSSSPVNTIPMLLYGAGGGIMTILIRNIGAFADGVLLAVLIMNLVSPLLDKIRPKALGKVG
ncbi:MAG: RnfABCDGE type electron transport complex subunit D [Desulfobacterales bacterium]